MAAEKWKKNPGKRPPEAKGKRVMVKLRNGNVCGREPVTTVTPAGWAVDTTYWGERGPFTVVEYCVL